MRPRYGRGGRGNPNFLAIFILLAIFSSFFEILGAGFELVFDLGFLALFIGVPIFVLVTIIKAISKAVNNSNNRNKGYTQKNVATVDTTALLKKMDKFFDANEELHIDEETYLKLGDPTDINLKNIDIYMRDEYIGTLQDYLTAYPNAYNSLASLITKYLNNKSKLASKKSETVTEEAPKQTAKKEEEKNAAYYIKTLQYLNSQNPNEQITAGLEETCKYLGSIKKIEDEYPDSKNKTVKLYQYYLPMLTDILANYNRLYASSTSTEEYKSSEDRLLKTIVLINGALKTISGGLLEDYYSEINVDMRTLESILKKDGLVEDFKQED